MKNTYWKHSNSAPLLSVSFVAKWHLEPHSRLINGIGILTYQSIGIVIIINPRDGKHNTFERLVVWLQKLSPPCPALLAFQCSNQQEPHYGYCPWTYGAFLKWGIPQNVRFMKENPMKMDDSGIQGYPYFRRPPYSSWSNSTWLVVWTPLKNMNVNWDDDIPNRWENKTDVPNHQPVIIEHGPCIVDLPMKLVIFHRYKKKKNVYRRVSLFCWPISVFLYRRVCLPHRI